VRQGIRWPQLYLAQLDAALAAASAVRSAGLPPPRLEILIPLVNSLREVQAMREMLDVVTERRPEYRDLRVTMGAMIETPGAALAAADLARVCDFLSFGTNDLTQLTLGLSRDDYLPILLSSRQAHLSADDPFTRSDPTVLRLVRDAAQASRSARPDIQLGVCGVHADDPRVLHLCTDGVLDYISVPRNRFLVTRLRAITFAARRPGSDGEA
jgi:pyruvate,orthophosphate dikinase